RRNGELARDYAARHGVPRWYDNAEALINDPEVDAVYIATPPSSHMQYTLLSAQAGKPVYVEKPMALDTSQCHAMIDACRVANVPLFVAYYRRALERFRAIKRLIDSQTIGEVRYVTITLCQPVVIPTDRDLPWRLNPAISGGGLFVDLAAHMLDLLDFMLGPISRVHGIATNQAGHYPAEDIVSGAMLFESGVHAVGTWCFSSGEQRDQTEIIGTTGTISYATFGRQPVIMTTPDRRQELVFEDPPHIQQPLIQSVVDALNGVGVCPSSGD
ncbi:MAG TPA: Gfo/Idh/MocA family oxidoreductase, partial [Roseiflexaceae bacterium]|nr:Gfo/Idh/MocA family oxidoreductase [Roseiflexaceae bacterium]